MVVSSSLTSQAALLVPTSGPTDLVMDRRSFTGWQNTAYKSRPRHL